MWVKNMECVVAHTERQINCHLSCCQGNKVVNSFWNSFPKDANDNSSHVFISDSDVEEHLQRNTVILDTQISDAEAFILTDT